MEPLLLLLIIPIAAMPLLVIAFFVRIFTNSRKLLPEEANKTPVFKGYFSGQLGWLNYRGPLVRFFVYEDLVVVASSKTYKFRIDEITKVTLGKMLWLHTIDIQHRNAEYPKKIQIRTEPNDVLKDWILRKNLG